MQDYTGYALVGGQDGSISCDILFLNNDGNFVLNNSSKNVLDGSHSIKSISISCGWIVDGISVTYQAVGGTAATFNHGSTFNPPSNVVTFGANEVLGAVFGRAGQQSYYNRTMVNNIGFVIFDTVSEAVRVVGPFGNSNKSNEGTPFYVSDVIAFGSFSQTSGTTAPLGLSGLFFYKSK